MPSEQKAGKEEIRSFIAIDISEDVRRALDSFIGELKPEGSNVRWVRIEGIHLTLKFLGNIPHSMTGEIEQAMSRAAKGTGTFEVQVKGAGAFPNLKKPRVYWVGIDEPSGKLADLAKRIEDELKALGFETENRAFKPHLTLGRVKFGGKAGRLAEIVGGARDRSFGSFEAKELVLFKSDLKPGGAVYSKLAINAL